MNPMEEVVPRMLGPHGEQRPIAMSGGIMLITGIPAPTSADGPGEWRGR